MWFQIVILVLFYLHAGSYARSIDSSVVDKLISFSIRNRRPVVIIVDPSKNLGVDFDNDGTFHERFEENKNDIFSSALRARDNRNCKQFLREKLKDKCADEADCTEVVWKLVKDVCDDDEPTQKSDETKQEITQKSDETTQEKSEIKKRKTAAPRKEDVEVYILTKKQ